MQLATSSVFCISYKLASFLTVIPWFVTNAFFDRSAYFFFNGYNKHHQDEHPHTFPFPCFVATLFWWSMSPSLPPHPSVGTLWSHLQVSLFSPECCISSLGPTAGLRPIRLLPRAPWPHILCPAPNLSLIHSLPPGDPSHVLQLLVLPHSPYVWGPSSFGNEPT